MSGFSIRFTLQTMNLSGLESVDWRRARGLSDKSNTYSDTSTVYCAVEDEQFIRTWFKPTQTNPGASVHPDWLAKDELVMSMNGDRVSLKNDLPESRVQALFIRAQFAALESKLTDIQGQLDVAQALLDKEDEVD